jgi:DNA mismatch repair ATPase MutS
MSYLDTILIKDKVLDSARFKVYDAEASKLSYMMLDNQALYHLEILSSSVSGQKGSDYSLFGCIDRTITAGGRRMLRRWVCAPLFSRHRIVDRQDAVDDLLHYRSERDTFRKALKGLPDLERLCARTYSYSIDKNTKAIYYEDFSLQRLKEFKELCKKLRYIDSELDKLSKLSHLVKS